MSRILLDGRRGTLCMSGVHLRRCWRRNSWRRRSHLAVLGGRHFPRGPHLLPREDHPCPALTAGRLLPDDVRERLHPAVFLLGAVGVEVNRLAVAEPHPEAFFYEHVAFLFLGKGRLAPRAGFA